jgi:hypothetical protein
MTRPKPARLRLWWCAALLALVLPAYAGAQVQSVDTSQPIVIRTNKGRVRKVRFWGQVLTVNPQMIQVRSRGNFAEIRTFSFTPYVSAKMARIRAKGGYHYGDSVKIVYTQGSDVALRITGKPSKSG